ncbi:hypothetical protein [Gardnerella sp. Marseille-Q2328]|uniref:hypothetical protein n=1 Tax=Gardnerella sp. Marseille-Q2328 TaxID=2759694 RepID=UPI002024F7E1|nr:hypothetical protein [Gardnerella sp. Marseille-Q2328]
MPEILPQMFHTNLPCLRQSRRRQTSLALKAHRAFNLSKLTLRVASARYAQSAKAGRRANAGEKTPANVPKNGRSSNKCWRKNSGKCSKKQPKQQQTPGIFRRMFQKMAEVATNAGEKTPANVPHQSALPSSIETKADLACVESTPVLSTLSKLGAPSCLRALNRSAQAGRRAARALAVFCYSCRWHAARMS